jgi:hypothetical protein
MRALLLNLLLDLLFYNLLLALRSALPRLLLAHRSSAPRSFASRSVLCSSVSATRIALHSAS